MSVFLDNWKLEEIDNDALLGFHSLSYGFGWKGFMRGICEEHKRLQESYRFLTYIRKKVFVLFAGSWGTVHFNI